MDAKYKSLIYKEESEEKAVIQQCIDEVKKNHSQYTEKEIVDMIDNQEYSDVLYDFVRYKSMIEGGMLFDLAVERSGKALWNSNSFPDTSTCKKICPFGDLCKSEYIQIDNNKYCIGQMYYMNYSEEIITSLSKERRICIYNENGQYIDLSADYDEQILSDFFFGIDDYICCYGENGNGENVIGYL